MAIYFGKPIPEWITEHRNDTITEHRNDTITLGELSDACEKGKAAYAWFMQEYMNEKKAPDIALQILGERYGYPEDPPEEGDDK